jgi:hypothetical protein
MSASSVASLVVRGLTLSDSSVGQSLIKLINTISSVIEDVKVIRVSTSSESPYFLEI